MSGRDHNALAASFAFFENIIAITLTTVTKSGISVVTLFSRTSRREFISPMILARIFPVGRESKNLKSSV